MLDMPKVISKLLADARQDEATALAMHESARRRRVFLEAAVTYLAKAPADHADESAT